MNKKILIVISNYYKDISHNLFLGATEYCNLKNIRNDYIKVSGSFEIPFVINKKKD